jgi:hypothetical protein
LGCSDQPGGAEPTDQIALPAQCGGTWDLQDVELYDGSDATYTQAFVAKHEGAVGRRCSGTLIGPDLFLTVAHSGCGVPVGETIGFNCQLSAEDPNPPDPDQAAADHCEWYSATSLVEYAGDVAVSRLAGNPGATYGWALPSRILPRENDKLAIIQHPVHDGRRKMVGFGPLNKIEGKDLRYAVDTSGGSSGAGVLDSNGFLIGLHRSDGCGASGGSNTGTSMVWVIDNVPEVRGVMAALWTITAG